MFSKKVLEKCNKEELIAKLLETCKKIQEKDNIITKLEKDLAKINCRTSKRNYSLHGKRYRIFQNTNFLSY